MLRMTRLALLLAVAPAAVRAQLGKPPERWAILLVVGADTIAMERAMMRPGSVAGELLLRADGSRHTWEMDFAGDGAVRRMLLVQRKAADAPNTPARQTLELTFTGDSVVGVVTMTGAAPVTKRAAAPRYATPFFNPSMALTEIAVRRLFATGVREGKATLLLLNGQSIQVNVTRLAADSIVIGIGGVELRVAVDSAGRFLGGRVPTQNLTIVRRPWLDDVALAQPKPDYSAPAGAPYTAEDVTIPTPRGFTMGATLTKPSGATRRLPVVVTITGSGPEDRDEGIPSVGDYRPFRQLADTLGRRGIAVLRYDERGVGATGGDFAAATSADFADDIRTIVAWLRTRPDIDPSRIVLAGHSEGGMLAPMVAADDPKLAGIVLMAGPSQSGRTILDFQLRNGIRGDTSHTSTQRDSMMATVPRMLDSVLNATPWMRYFGSYDPIATIKRVKVPVLILQGGTDQQVTPEQAGELQAALRASGNRRVTMRLFPETNHLMVADPSGFPGGYATLPSVRVRPEVVGAVADWVVALVAVTAR